MSPLSFADAVEKLFHVGIQKTRTYPLVVAFIGHNLYNTSGFVAGVAGLTLGEIWEAISEILTITTHDSGHLMSVATEGISKNFRGIRGCQTAKEKAAY